jgi:carbon monoxide dehydrogenase subunit G
VISNGQNSELPYLKSYENQSDRLSLHASRQIGSLNELATAIDSNITFELFEPKKNYYHFQFDLWLDNTGNIDCIAMHYKPYHQIERALNANIPYLPKGWKFEEERETLHFRLFLRVRIKQGKQRVSVHTEPPPPPPPPPPPRCKLDEVFKWVPNMPHFPGCEEISDKEEKWECSEAKLQRFIAYNIRVPQKAIDDQVAGKVVVKIIIEKNGSTTIVDIKQDIGYGIGTEVKRVLEILNEKGLNWTTGPWRGRPLRVLRNIIFEFRYEDFLVEKNKRK